MWKEMTMAQFELLSCCLLGGNKKDMKTANIQTPASPKQKSEAFEPASSAAL
jgi:hypothetical protein